MYKRLPRAKWDDKRGRWVISIMIDGTRKQFTSQNKRTGKREVETKCSEWAEKFGTDDKTSRRLSEVWEVYLSDYLNRKGENEQFRQIRILGSLYLIPMLGRKSCGSLGVDDFQSVINSARSQKDGGQLSKKYLKNIKGVVVSFCRWAYVHDYIRKDPSGQLYIPIGAPEGERQILQISDIEKLFKNRTGYWYERALLLEILTGLRPGEIIGLQIDDYRDGCLYIRRAINASRKVTPGKNKNAIRCINLAPQANALVVEQIEIIRQLVAHSSEKWLFCNKIGGQPAQAELRRCWARIEKAHGFAVHTTPYCLRHTFFAHTEAHLPDRLIKQVFGHSAKTDSHGLYGRHDIDGEAQEATRLLQITPLYEAAQGE